MIAYWHIGATQIRFRKVTPRTVRGVNSCGVVAAGAVGTVILSCWRCWRCRSYWRWVPTSDAESSEELAQSAHSDEVVHRRTESRSSFCIDRLVIDEHQLIDRDSQFADDLAIDRRIGFDRIQLGAHKHPLEEARHWRDIERADEVETGTRQQG